LVTLHQVLESVGLENVEKIDIFKIDCEGCEYNIFTQVYNVRPVVQQVLIEFHGVNVKTSNTHVKQIFNGLLNNGYVIFHKESNMKHDGGGSIEYGFLKLVPGFSGGVERRLRNVVTSNPKEIHSVSQTNWSFPWSIQNILVGNNVEQSTLDSQLTVKSEKRIPFSKNRNNWSQGFQLFHFVLFYEYIPPSSYCTVESLHRVLQVAGSLHKTKMILWTKNESFDDRMRFLLGAVVCNGMDEPCDAALDSSVVWIHQKFDSIISDTPFVQLFSFPQGNNLGRFANQNKANAMRLALVFKYGGCYCDVDFIFLGSDPAMMRRGAGEESKRKINNAIFKFDAREPVVKYLMEEFVRGYNGNKWGHQGPGLFTRVFTGGHCFVKWNLRTVQCTGGQTPFDIHPTNKVYPIHFNEITRWAGNTTLGNGGHLYHVSDKFLNNSDVLHTWNKKIAKWESDMIHTNLSHYFKSNLAVLRKRLCPVSLGIMTQGKNRTIP